jgi:hypothetical protein
MRLMLAILSVIFIGSVYGQTTKKNVTTKPVKKDPIDTVVLLGNRKIPGFVKQVGVLTVLYTLEAKPDSLITVQQKDLEKIIFRNGKIEPFNKAVIDEVDDKQWQSILLTKKEKDVAGLYKRGAIAGKSKPNARSKKDAQASGTIKIQKQAAALKATIILITKEEFYGGFGDPQGYYVEGIAYGLEPLEKGTNVVDKKENQDDKEELKK